MKQDFSGFLDCVKSVSVSDIAGGKACMAKNGYDPNLLTVDQAVTQAKSQLAQDIAHHELTWGDGANVAVFLFIASLFVVPIIFARRAVVAQRRQWRELPTVECYLATHPVCRTGAGIKCVSCGSKSIKNWGLTGAKDELRTFICNSCGKSLYRSEEGRA